jgi:aspartyl-tRNA(Asn)/glutamyl-tRNA(Gln) amidotransferase subunit A
VTKLYHLSVTEAGRLIAAHKLSPVDLVEAVLARIEAIDSRLHSYITVVADRARAEAKVAEAEIMAGRWRGPLHGIPFGVKDNYYTAGIRTTGASRLMLDHVPTETATCILKLQDAGAILVGKLNAWEYGTGGGGFYVYDDLPFPLARNPWNTDRYTGGSSTGAGASVPAGTALFALGSDTGGSVRLPAAACGLQGLKATYGLISRAGCLPNCWSLDVNGALTWTVEDNAIVTQTMAGYDAKDPASVETALPDFRKSLHAGVEGLVIGVVREFGSESAAIEPRIAQATDDAAKVLADAGAELRDMTLPASLATYQQATGTINVTESLSIHEQDFMTRSHLMGRSLREKMMSGFAVRAVDYLAALRLRRSLANSTDAMIRSCDAIIMPGAFHVAPRFSDRDLVGRFSSESTTSVFNLTGHPAISILAGFDDDGMPLNVQVVGRYFDEATVLRVAQAYEAATTWRLRRPEL